MVSEDNFHDDDEYFNWKEIEMDHLFCLIADAMFDGEK